MYTLPTVIPGQVDLFFRVLSLAMLVMVTRLILDYGNTFATATLLTTVFSYHVQLPNAILYTPNQHHGHQNCLANVFHYLHYLKQIFPPPKKNKP